MKILNKNNRLKLNLSVVAVMLSFLATTGYAINDSSQTDVAIKSEIRKFFDDYLNTYNQRFGKPDRTESFIQALSSLIHDPFLMSPPTNTPFQPQDQTHLTRVFDGFVQNLEKKGAVKLVWKSVNLQVLSPHKVLANNIAFATDANGEVVYETISIYLLYRDENAWKIALFSPYELERSVVLKSTK